MKILAIETSCDETAVAILDASGSREGASFTILGNALLSQVDIHKEYGGVYPALAKRAHAKNLVPLLAASLEEAEMLREDRQALPTELHDELVRLLEREPGLADSLLAFAAETERPAIDAIAVTSGPGLEPALWVGINFAKALSRLWDIPVVPVNHMEGHLLAALAESEGREVRLGKSGIPILALLVSGGHTELVLMDDWLSYRLLGATRDDAAGEAFDKVARMLGLPYPGGPEISRLAENARKVIHSSEFSLPRPMITSADFDFSFSGLKTAVLYLVKEKGALTETQKEQLAREFEDAVVDVLYAKSSKALAETGAMTMTIGGGVSANTHLRRTFAERLSEEHPGVTLRIPPRELSTDNAVMIGIAGYFRTQAGAYAASDIHAEGNLALA